MSILDYVPKTNFPDIKIHKTSLNSIMLFRHFCLFSKRLATDVIIKQRRTQSGADNFGVTKTITCLANTFSTCVL